MTSSMNQQTPCNACPVHTWAAIRDSTEAEKAIRRDQRRLDLRELQADAKLLTFLIDRLTEQGVPKQSAATLEQLRRVAGHLITQSERRAAA